MAQEAKHLIYKYEALSLNYSTAKRLKKKKSKDG
jgi:hypothetical protein